MRNVGKIVGKFHHVKFDKVKNKQNIIYYTYILFSKTKTLQENIDWSSVKEENVPIFVPPITFGKVLKIYTGDTFVLATKLPFFHETIETAPICKFTIHLDGVSAPIDKENGSITKEILIQKIEHQIVQLRDVSTDRHGKIYAKVFLAEENVNEWLLKNQYVVKSQNGKKRRMSIIYFLVICKKIKRILTTTGSTVSSCFLFGVSVLPPPPNFVKKFLKVSLRI